MARAKARWPGREARCNDSTLIVAGCFLSKLTQMVGERDLRATCARAANRKWIVPEHVV